MDLLHDKIKPMLTHFVKRKNTLHLVKPEGLLYKLREISVTGFSTFFIDVAMGILTVLFNRQIMRYLGADALWLAMPVTELLVALYAAAAIRRFTRALPRQIS